MAELQDKAEVAPDRILATLRTLVFPDLPNGRKLRAYMHLLFRTLGICLILLPSIACKGQEVSPMPKPQGSEKGVTFDDFQALIGESFFSLKVMDISQRVGKNPQIVFSSRINNTPPQFFNIYWEDIGINLRGRKDLIIREIQIIVQKWDGDLPSGFQKTTSAEEVKKTLGKPDFFIPSVYGKSGTMLEYREKGLNLFFFPTDKAKERLKVGPEDPTEAIEYLGRINVTAKGN